MCRLGLLSQRRLMQVWGMLDQTLISMFRRRLQEMKQDLEALSQATEDERKPVALDQQSVGRLSRMDAMQQRAMQIATERRRRLSLVRIDAALLRVDEDEFGYCVGCGEEIAVRRLEHDPSITTCVTCAQKGA